MLDAFIPKLIKDLELGNTTLQAGSPGAYSLPIGDNMSVTLATIDNGFMLKCLVAPIPKKDEEAFINFMMRGNLFGKETHNAVLGLTHDGSQVTLTHVVDYQVDYNGFKHILEDFINVVDFWREQAKAKV